MTITAVSVVLPALDGTLGRGRASASPLFPFVAEARKQASRNLSDFLSSVLRPAGAVDCNPSRAANSVVHLSVPSVSQIEGNREVFHNAGKIFHAACS